MSTVFELDSPYPSDPYTIELYSLPVVNHNREESHGGIEWFEMISRMTVEEVKIFLSERWAFVTCQQILDITNALLGYTADSIVHVSTPDGFDELPISLRLVLPDSATDWGAQCFLPRPPNPEVVRENLHRANIVDDMVVEFACALGGYRETYLCGIFQDFTKPLTKATDLYFSNEKRIWGWEESIVFYLGCEGDQLLLHPDGRLGFWYHASTEIRLFANSFKEFCEKYHRISHVNIVERTVMSVTKRGFDSWTDHKYRQNTNS